MRRVRDPGDERQVTIVLTQAGHALQGKAATVPTDLECMTQLDGNTTDHLIEAISRVRSNLQAACNDSLAAV